MKFANPSIFLLMTKKNKIFSQTVNSMESVKCKICPNEKRPEMILLIDRRYLRPFLHLQALKIPAAKAHFSLRVLVFSVLIRSSSGIFGE